jgi:hypothetical protein
MELSKWQRARLVNAHSGAVPKDLFSSARAIEDTREIVLVREIPRSVVNFIDCDAERFFEVKGLPGEEIDCVCEHEVLTD